MVTVSAPAGEIVGIADGAIARFLGIPYAEAPLGVLRFRAPVPRARFTEPFHAVAHGATPQVGQPTPFTTIPEPSVSGDDILTLTITAPTTALQDPGAALPVMVWIHGGGYVTGTPASPWYDGGAFARDGVITAVISYRLGIEGFMHFDGDEEDANRGMQDWLCALRWVNENIAAFGGDPTRVTVAGQSAGGAAVLALLASPASEGLFARAAVMSGMDRSLDADEAVRTTVSIAAELGIAPTPESFVGVDRMRLQQLAMEWLAAHPAGGVPFAPVHGTELLPIPVEAALETHGTQVPLLMGSTLDEFDSPGWPAMARAAGVDAPPVAPLPDGRRITDVMFRAACARVAKARGAAAPTWLYSFDWVSPPLGGAGHCVDLPFFFDCLSADGVEAALGANPPQKLADRMHSDLIDFVRGEVLPWPVARGHADDVARRYGVEGGHADEGGVYDSELMGRPKDART